jgi:hypothetical protein
MPMQEDCLCHRSLAVRQTTWARNMLLFFGCCYRLTSKDGRGCQLRRMAVPCRDVPCLLNPAYRS